MKRIIRHSEKTLYLEAIANDLSVDGANAPEAAGRDVDEHDRHVPYDQMVYIGDGASDLHAFGFITKTGGLSVAVQRMTGWIVRTYSGEGSVWRTSRSPITGGAASC